MGFKISWVGVNGLSKSDVLGRLNFSDTGCVDEANEAPFSITTIPNGWVIVFSNYFEFGEAEHVREFSKGIDLISCQIHEGIMYSAAHCSRDRANLWSVWHDGQAGSYDCQVTGEPSTKLKEIVDRLHAEQTANGGAQGDVDYGFDIPVELAFQITGYRHDLWKYPWGQPHFSVIERNR